MILIVNSDYVVCHNPHNIIILDIEKNTIVKTIHSDNTFISCSLDDDNVYYAELIFHSNNILDQNSTITKYNIKQDTQKTIFDTNDIIGDILAIDDKIVFLHAVENKIGIRYIDIKTMENNFFTVENDDRLDSSGNVIDILFDGQRIIYEELDRAFYSICIFTGETKKIELSS